MTAPISGSSGAADAIAAASSAKSAAAAETSKSKNEMDRDLFLKLLVAQLKYQDPSNPANATEFLAQTAQFTMVERLDELKSAQQALLATQQMLGATGLIGRTVTYTGADGIQKTGVVTSATISGSNPTVKVGNTDVPLSSVREVHHTS